MKNLGARSEDKKMMGDPTDGCRTPPDVDINKRGGGFDSDLEQPESGVDTMKKLKY